MNLTLSKKRAGFTLVELLIGMTLSLMLMTAVLTSYVTLGRNFTRSLGVSSANQPTLESQSRRTLAYFTEDVRMASGITAPASPDTLVNAVKLSLPSGTTGTTILYYFNSNTSSQYLHSNDTINSTSASSDVEFKTNTLTRVNLNTRVYQILHNSLLTFILNYYDSSGNLYSSSDLSSANYLPGIKQLSISFTSQAGSSVNGTLTQIYETDSPRLIIRNKALLP